jgi:hypothetical protein
MPAARARLMQLLPLVCLLGQAVPVRAQPIVEYVTLTNGDRLTGEVKGLERGRLELSTSYASSVYIEWDKVVSVEAMRLFEVGLEDGRTFLGSLAGANDGLLIVKGPVGDVPLPIQTITDITPIGRSFWRKLDGSFDVGFNYTKSSGIAQFNLGSQTTLRNPRSQWALSMSFTQTATEGEAGTDDRGWIELSHTQYRWTNWFTGVAGRFETNESLGLRLRSQFGGVIGPSLVRSNRAQLAVGAGLALNDELGTDGEHTENLEGLIMLQSSFYTYDLPRTNIDVGLQYYPSLSSGGRQRLQFNATVKREVFKDLFISVSTWNSFDSRPPDDNSDKNDFGVVLSIGWSY